MTPGCVYVNDSGCFDGNFNYSLGLFVDHRLAGKFLLGLAADLQGIGSDDVDFYTSDLIDVSLSLKAQLGSRTGRVAVRPGLGVGYGTVEVLGDRVGHVTLRGFLEALFPTRGRLTWMSELAVYGAVGDSENVDTSFGPGLFFRAGIVF